MSEGGYLPWKRQTIDTRRGPAANFDVLHSPLPSPPKGQHWIQDPYTKEWRVVPKDSNEKIIEAEHMVEATVVEVVDNVNDVDVDDRKDNDTEQKPSHVANEKNAAKVEVTESLILPEAQIVHLARTQPNTYLEHWIQDDVDTFAGICLRYKLTPTELRRANFGFSGTNLKLAPNPLRIPQTLHTAQAAARLQIEAQLPQNLRRRLIKACPKLTRSEAQCYMDLNDGNLSKAIQQAREDGF